MLAITENYRKLGSKRAALVIGRTMVALVNGSPHSGHDLLGMR